MKWLYTCCIVLASCKLSPEANAQLTQALELAEGIGDAVLRSKGAAELAHSVPELMPLIDTNKDAIITLDEVKAFLHSAAANPKSIGLLIGTLLILRQ
jgi:hypothetical protein